jgi:hypothetical protein
MQTLREQQVLRFAKLLRPRRKLTPAGRFIVGYAITVVVAAYLVADWVTRVAS